MIKRHKHHPLLESQKFIGKWWLPDRPDTEIHGELIYEDNKDLILKTTGTFSDHHFREFPPIPIIYGLTNEGKKLTLCKCYILEAEQTRPGKAAGANARSYFYG